MTVEPLPPLQLPRRLLDTIPEGKALLETGAAVVAEPIGGYEWLRPTMIGGKHYDWWQHTSGHLRLAPSLLQRLKDVMA